MHARHLNSVALTAALVPLSVSIAFAGGGGHGGGGAFRPAFGVRGGFAGFHGGFGGRARSGGQRGMPPVAGVIHERAGIRPYLSAYGHTNTAARFGGFPGGAPAYGHAATALRYGGGYGADRAGYGHVAIGFRYGAERRIGGVGEGRRRFAERRGFVGGGFGGGYGFGDGTYGAPGIYGDAGVYGRQGTYGNSGTYGQAGTYGQPGIYGGTGTYATQSVYGNGGGTAYRSETPLAARFAEPPLGPSPYAPYSPGDRYAYAASEDAGPGPRVVNPYRIPSRLAGQDCACGSRGQPVFYRYGIGTAY